MPNLGNRGTLDCRYFLEDMDRTLNGTKSPIFDRVVGWGGSRVHKMTGCDNLQGRVEMLVRNSVSSPDVQRTIVGNIVFLINFYYGHYKYIMRFY